MWIATALSLFLVLVLPVCWSGALTRAWQELGQGPGSNSSNNNEEREERELVEKEGRVVAGARPDLAPPVAEVTSPRAPRVPHHVLALASVAPKPHPSRFSERRLR